MDERDGALRLVVPPQRAQGCTVLVAGGVFLATGAAFVPQGDWLLVTIGTVSLALGLFVSYFGLVGFANSVTIVVDRERIRVTAGPIRWPRTGFDLALADVGTVHEKRIGESGSRYETQVELLGHRLTLPTGELTRAEAELVSARLASAIARMRARVRTGNEIG